MLQISVLKGLFDDDFDLNLDPVCPALKTSDVSTTCYEMLDDLQSGHVI